MYVKAKTMRHNRRGLAVTELALLLPFLAMLFVMAVIASAVYAWIGVGFLRRGWINLDLLWTAALGVAGAGLIAL